MKVYEMMLLRQMQVLNYTQLFVVVFVEFLRAKTQNKPRINYAFLYYIIYNNKNQPFTAYFSSHEI